MPSTVLIVDDDPNNVEILELSLQEVGYRTLAAADGREGLSVLREHPEVEVILLDRMMPNLDGLGFMREFLADEHLEEIPVIMQTAKASVANIQEGIESGVYYYLTKPFRGELMLTLVGAALRELSARKALRTQLNEHVNVLQSMVKGTFCFRSLPEARQLGALLVTLSPGPALHAVALTELLINAVEHGIAALGHRDKGRCIQAGRGKWEEEVNARLLRASLVSRGASVDVQVTKEAVVYTISDGGEGFEWEQFLELDPRRAFDAHGRGIAMANIAFDLIEFQGNGNTVVAKALLHP